MDGNLENMAIYTFLNCHPSKGFAASVSTSSPPRSHLGKSFVPSLLLFSAFDRPDGDNDLGGDDGEDDGDDGNYGDVVCRY